MKKTSTLKQTFGLFGTHAIMCLFILLVMTGILALVSNYAALQTVVGILIALIYAYTLFTSAYGYAVEDLKPYTATKAYPAKGAVLSMGIVGFIIAAWIYYVVVWRVAPITDTQIPPATIVANLIYSFLTAPLWGFVDVQGSNANLAGQIAALVLPVGASAFGYYLGYIKVDYTKYINKFVFEKKK